MSDLAAEVGRLRLALFLIPSMLSAQDINRDAHVVEHVRRTLARHAPLPSPEALDRRHGDTGGRLLSEAEIQEAEGRRGARKR